MPATPLLNSRHIWPLLLSCTLALVGCEHETSQSLMSRAATRLAAGDRKAATILLKSAVQKDDKNGAAHFQLAKLQYEQDDYLFAEKEFRRARSAGFAADKIDPLLAQTWLRLGHFQQVIDEIPKPTAGGLVEAGYWVARANAHLGLKKIDDARDELAKALALVSNDADTQLTEARMSLIDGKRDVALTQIDAALRAAPSKREAWLFKGDVLRAGNNLPEAEAAYRSVLKIDSDHIGARLAIAGIALAQNRLAEAKSQVAIVLKAAPKSVLGRYTQATIDFREKQYSVARDHLAGALRDAPNYLPALLLGGSIDFALGSMASAETQLNKVVTAIPGNTYARRMLAASQLRQGRADDAEHTLAALDPDHSGVTGVLVLAGEIALTQKQYAAASGYFEKAAQIDPQNAAIRTEVGIVRLAQGDALGQADLVAAAAMPGESGRADSVLLLSQLRNRQFDAALASAAALIKKQPANPVSWNYRGVAYLGKNDRVNARANFAQAQKLSPEYFLAVANLARLDLQDKHPDTARARIDAFLKANPDSLPAMLALAELNLTQNKDEQAFISGLEKASNSHPQALEPRELLARYYLTKRAYSKALAQAREAVSAQPDNPAALNLLGEAQFASQDLDNALATYRKLADRYPVQVQLRLKLAQVQLAMKQPDDARKSLQVALKSKPDFIEALLMLGSLEIQSGNFAEAQKIAVQIQTLPSGMTPGLLLAGDVDLTRKQYPLALGDFEHAYKLSPSPVTLIRVYQALTGSGRVDDANKRLFAWLQDHPGDASVRLYLADRLTERNQYKAASEQYLYLNQQTPNNLQILNNLAWSLSEINDKRALGYAQQALKLKPDNAPVMDTVGWLLVKQGDSPRGIALLQKALSKTPDAGEVHYHLASAYLKAGDRVRAKNEFSRLLASGVSFPHEVDARAQFKQLQ
jgi:putative PEP-CTERM system TPR-repeat lipoprotein